jgi:uncharacterized protein (TIGR02145 family)
LFRQIVNLHKLHIFPGLFLTSSKVKIIFINSGMILIIILMQFCQKSEDMPTIPVVFTTTCTDITQTSATSGGNVSDDGGSEVTARGVCWGTSSNPTISGSRTTNSTGKGSFTSNITNLSANTKYYLRAYATNSVGTAYGNAVIFKTYTSTVSDINGNVYNTITIGTVAWMVENLKTTKYRNGELIGTTTPAALDINLESTPKYQWAYDGNESNVATYGRLYTWYAATDSRNVCPTGWHVPTDAEWTTLTDYLKNNGYGYQGNIYFIGKSMAATSGWTTVGAEGTVGNDQASNNSSGFTALPSGTREGGGTFSHIGSYCYWWCSTEHSSMNAFSEWMFSSYSQLFWGYNGKQQGFSIRCIKDN